MTLWHSALLSWNANAELDLAGYRIYYGRDPLVMTNMVDVVLTATPARPAFTIQTLPSYGRWYFNVTAYNTGNLESVHSGAVSKIIVDDGPGGCCGG